MIYEWIITSEDWQTKSKSYYRQSKYSSKTQSQYYENRAEEEEKQWLFCPKSISYNPSFTLCSAAQFSRMSEQCNENERET